jgi:NAD(P)-dependent dehydrogenase (short-subunit alcohol dehydrogenase family)
VLNAAEVQGFADAVQARFGGDMLINNAGQGYAPISAIRRARPGCTKPN